MPRVAKFFFLQIRIYGVFLKRKEGRRKQRGRGVYVRHPRRPELLVRRII